MIFKIWIKNNVAISAGYGEDLSYPLSFDSSEIFDDKVTFENRLFQLRG